MSISLTPEEFMDTLSDVERTEVDRLHLPPHVALGYVRARRSEKGYDRPAAGRLFDLFGR